MKTDTHHLPESTAECTAQGMYNFIKFDDICSSPLFRDFTEEEFYALLSTMNSYAADFEKDAYIYCAGDIVRSLGFVLSGSVRIENIDLAGNRRILGQAMKNDVFAEAYACLKNQPMLVDVAANEKCTILFLKVSENPALDNIPERIIIKLQRNLLHIANMKSLRLSIRNLHTSSRSIRDRITSFLSTQVLQHGSSEFSIPFDRQQMADYLNLDRSSLSRELGKMKTEGLIDFHKNTFIIKTDFDSCL